MATNTALTDDEVELLRIAGAPLHRRGEREHVIHERLGMSPTQFWQRVNALLDDVRALEHDAHLVYRLRRIRDRRSRRRLTGQRSQTTPSPSESRYQ